MFFLLFVWNLPKERKRNAAMEGLKERGIERREEGAKSGEEVACDGTFHGFVDRTLRVCTVHFFPCGCRVGVFNL